jgi:predicted transcriptional regulator
VPIRVRHVSDSSSPGLLHLFALFNIMKAIENKRNLFMRSSKDLYLEERRQQVLERIRQHGRISVAELSADFGVSEVTVRADLQALAEQKLIVRTHGGAIPLDADLNELALASAKRLPHWSPMEMRFCSTAAALR